MYILKYISNLFFIKLGEVAVYESFLFHFSNVQPFGNTCLKEFFEIRKIPEVIGI